MNDLFTERDHAILVGDVRETHPAIPDGSVQMVATSPPYFGLRLYGDDGAEIGKERDLDAYVQSIVDVMRICRAKLRDDGTAWVNLGDSYASSTKGGIGVSPASGLKRDGRSEASRARSIAIQNDHLERETVPIDCGVPDGNALLVPFRVAAALQADGWTLRAMLPWVKLAAMPESVQSRPCIAHEYVLFLTKRPSGYFYDADAVRLPLNWEHAQRRFTPQRNKDGIDRRQHGAPSGNVRDVPAPGGNPAGRSLRSSDIWRAGAREAGAALLAAAEGEAVGMLTNDDAPAAFVVNPKGSGIPHFAMWPTRLVAPMIMAGTPEAGCCSVCGAPWMRVIDERADDRKAYATIGTARRTPTGGMQSTINKVLREDGRGGDLATKQRQTIGFRPSCDHDAPAVPAVVLDPFAGACTTLGVASALGRRSIGCELYQKNADLAPQRIDIVRTEMVEYLREIGDTKRAAGVVLAQREARHAGIVADAGPLFTAR